MRNKVLEKAKVSLPSGSNGFDRSQERSQTSLCGEIDVAYAQPFVKGSKVRLSRKNFTRTADVLRPAFHRVSEHFDFFAVPIHCMWRSFENWKLNMNDLQDSNLVPFNASGTGPDLALPSSCPRMDYSDIISKLGWSGVGQSADNVRKCNDVLRFGDELQLGVNRMLQISSEAMPANVLNLFLLGSYQKCYFQFYRNSAYESNNPLAYNFDWLFANGGNGLLDPSSGSKPLYVARQLFTRRRVNFRNDIYHNIYPALNYVLSTPNGISFSVPSNIGGFASSSVQNELITGNTPNGGQVYVAAAQNSNNRAIISAQGVRAAFALDRLLRASAYAPKRVRDQYKAQFGVDGHEYDSDMNAKRIGSFQSDVAFQEVTNMAQSNSADLGVLGAKGVGGDPIGEMLEYYCEYDCIIICMHYFSMRPRYDSFGIHPWNTHLLREDFYQRAFENLGLRPMYAAYLTGDQAGYQSVCWTVPNFEYKISPDLNLHSFKQYFYEFHFQEGDAVPLASQSELSCYVPHSQLNTAIVDNRIQVLTPYWQTYEWFKVRPEFLNNIFKVAVPSDHRISYFQFMCDFRIIVSVVAPMGVHCQPV